MQTTTETSVQNCLAKGHIAILSPLICLPLMLVRHIHQRQQANNLQCTHA